MALPPIIVGIIAIVTLLAKFSMGFEWLPAIASGLIAGGVTSFVLGGAKTKMGVYLLLGGVLLYFLAPQLASLSLSSGAKELAIATWSVTPTPVTNGISISGSTFIVPLTYNTSANTLDKDPIDIKFSVVRTDTGTNDASFKVSVNPDVKITDPTTGLQYNAVEKDAMQKFKVFINDTSDGSVIQDSARVFPMKYGVSSKEFIVRIDLNAKAFSYLNNYQSVSIPIEVAGTQYTILLQRVQ